MHGWYRSVSAWLVVAAETTNTLLSFRFEGQENLLNQNANAWGRMAHSANLWLELLDNAVFAAVRASGA